MSRSTSVRQVVGVVCLGLVFTSVEPAVAQQTFGPGAGFTIPDNNGSGGNSSINISLAGNPTITSVSSVTFTTNVPHTFVGDLRARLIAPNGQDVHLFSRVGYPALANGDSSDLSGTYTFTAAGASFASAAAGVGGNSPVPPGTYARSTNSAAGGVYFDPDTYSVFEGDNVNGAWTLNISDHAAQDTGSIASWTISITTCVTPSTPTLAGAIGTTGSVLISWSNVSNETGYGLERSVGSPSGPWSPVQGSPFGANVNAAQDSAVTNGTNYHYRVYAFNACGNSAYSSILCGIPLAAPMLTAPADGATISGTSATLTWNPVSGANLYGVDLGTSTCGSTSILNNAPATSPFPTPSLAPGTYYWRVRAANGGSCQGVSTPSTCRSFTISAAPVVTNVIPNPVVGSNSSSSMTINGTGFASGATVTWRDVTNNDTYPGGTPSSVTSTQINVGAVFGTDPAVWSAQVVNPGGASSNQFPFNVNAPFPIITSISPTITNAGGPSFTLTVNGSTFGHASVVQWNGSNRATMPIPSAGGQLVVGLTATILASDIAAPGTASVTVFSPGPGGGTSSPLTFTINAVEPPVPVWHSRPGAPHILYLDFNGATGQSLPCGGFANINTPAFDQNGNTSTFSASEINTMQQIFEIVSEDYLPFNVDVTTAVSTGSNVATVVIGGDGAWVNNPNWAGVACTNAYANSLPNVAFVFSDDLNEEPHITGHAASHEAGHMYGLAHYQTSSNPARIMQWLLSSDQWTTWFDGATCNCLSEPGGGDPNAPICGVPDDAPETVQDDMLILESMLGGLAPDDVGNTQATAPILSINNGQFAAEGFIGTLADVDYFQIVAPSSGQLAAAVDVSAANNGNLDSKVTLFDAAGSVLIENDLGSGQDSSISFQVQAGTFYLRVASNGGYGEVGAYSLAGTLTALPVVSFAATQFTSTESSSSATITVSLSSSSTQTVSVMYNASGGTATSGSDYLAANGTLTWLPGQSGPKTFNVPILNDGCDELNETVDLTLSSPMNCVIGPSNTSTLTLTDDDPAPTIAFSGQPYSHIESGSQTVTVMLTGCSAQTVSVNYATSDGSATANSDYLSANGALIWTPSQSGVRTFDITIIPDANDEPDESVNIGLSAPANASISGASSTTLTILDDDDVPPVSILSANPPAVNPYPVGGATFLDVLDTGTGLSLTAGIGAAGTADQGTIQYWPIRVVFSAPPVPAPATGNIDVGCTAGLCPVVTAVTTVNTTTFDLLLSGAIPPGQCTTLTFAGTSAGQKLQYRSLPGNVNLDGLTNTQDFLPLIQALNDGTANNPTNLARYNINRSTGASPVNTQDLLRLVQLLNGTNTTQAFNGATIAACP